METALQKRETSSLEIPSDISVGALEMALGTGDFSRFTPGDKLRFLQAVCVSVGFNALTLPIRIIKMDGREVMYATAEASAQLSYRDKVSIKKVEEKTENDCYVVRVIASTPDGRTHEDIGVVEMLYPEKTVEWRNGQKVYVPHPDAGKPFRGKDWANAVMKCHTKASRRAILRICSLGIPDESELEEMPRAQVSAVQTLIAEESVDAKLEKLNSQLTSSEKAGAIEAEVIAPDVKREHHNLDGGLRPPTETPDMKASPSIPISATTQQAPPPQVESQIPSQPAASGLLTDAEVAMVEAVFSQLPDPRRAMDYCIYRGWLQRGALINTLSRANFMMMTAPKNLPTFKRYVDGWKGTL